METSSLPVKGFRGEHFTTKPQRSVDKPYIQGWTIADTAKNIIQSINRDIILSKEILKSLQE